MWSVTIVPADVHGVQGVHVCLNDGAIDSHFAWIAYDRWRSIKKLRTFKSAMRDAIERAEAEAERLNS